jgi:hypothetical protein
MKPWGAYWVFLALFVALQIADILTTNSALKIPGVWELNPLMALSQTKLGAAWWLPKLAVVAYLCGRGQLHAPALADHFCRVDFRPRRAWQSLPHVDLIRGSGSGDCIRAQKDPGYPPGRFWRQAAYPSPVGLIIGWSSERILSLPNRSGRCYPRLW